MLIIEVEKNQEISTTRMYHTPLFRGGGIKI